jgi:hypothetical protein
LLGLAAQRLLEILLLLAGADIVGEAGVAAGLLGLGGLMDVTELAASLILLFVFTFLFVLADVGWLAVFGLHGGTSCTLVGCRLKVCAQDSECVHLQELRG